MWTMVRVQVFLLVLLIQIVTAEHEDYYYSNTEDNEPTENEIPGTEEPTADNSEDESPANHTVSQIHRPPVSEVICGHSQIEISLTGHTHSHIQHSGLNVSSGHMADQSCSSFTVRDDRVWYHVQPRADICGNMFETNHTHATYSNSLFVYPANGSTPTSFPFSCTYPLYTEISLNAISPLLHTLRLSSDMRNKVKTELDNSVSIVASQPNISVALFQNADYTEPYPAGLVTLAVGSALHVQLSVEEVDERFVVVLDDCYAGHSSIPEDSNNRHYYIRNMCPEGHQVKVDENGTSLKARFSTLLFLFGGSHSDIFLHCTLHMCDQRTSSCRPTCSRRAKRFAPRTAGLPLKLMTIGPITYEY